MKELSQEQIIEEYLTICRWEDELLDDLISREEYRLEVEYGAIHTDFEEVDSYSADLAERVSEYSFKELKEGLDDAQSSVYSKVRYYLLRMEMIDRVKKNPLLGLSFPLELLFKK
jgi:hypothetical protein